MNTLFWVMYSLPLIVILIYITLRIGIEHKKYNEYNSSLIVRCSAKEKCNYRHSPVCAYCKYNYGAKTIKTE